MKITLSLIEKLIRLRSGVSLPASALRGEWVEELLRDGTLINCSHGSKRSIIASSPLTLEQALGLIDERLGNLDVMKRIYSGNSLRSEQAAASGNSKLVQVRSCPGFPVNSYEPISCLLNGQEIVVQPQEGTFLFVSDWKNFLVPKDVVIVGIENMENFRLIRQQKNLFSSLLPNRRILFVSRFPQSLDLRLWLKDIPNSYVHFGDFDIYGIQIFLTEFQKYLGERSSFLIPVDIEERLKNGSWERYREQNSESKNIFSNIPELQRLIDLIHKYQRAYNQEGYIEVQQNNQL